MSTSNLGELTKGFPLTIFYRKRKKLDLNIPSTLKFDFSEIGEGYKHIIYELSDVEVAEMKDLAEQKRDTYFFFGMEYIYHVHNGILLRYTNLHGVECEIEAIQAIADKLDAKVFALS